MHFGLPYDKGTSIGLVKEVNRVSVTASVEFKIVINNYYVLRKYPKWPFRLPLPMPFINSYGSVWEYPLCVWGRGDSAISFLKPPMNSKLQHLQI